MEKDELAEKVTESENPLAGLLSNPDLMSKLSGVLSGLDLGTQKPPDTAALMTKLPDLVAAVAPMMKQEEKKPSIDKRTALLLALRPYLSPSRCEAIDYFTKIEKLGKLLTNFKL